MQFFISATGRLHVKDDCQDGTHLASPADLARARWLCGHCAKTAFESHRKQV